MKGEADFISWIDLFWQKKPHKILRWAFVSARLLYLCFGLRFFIPQIALGIIGDLTFPINCFLFIERTYVAYEIG